MKGKTFAEIEGWLVDNGYDGLYAENECACLVGNLAPCGCDVGDALECNPGYKVPCPGSDKCHLYGDCDFHVQSKKPESRDSEEE